MTTYRRGDIVTIKAEVLADWTGTAPAGRSPESVYVQPIGYFDTIFISSEHVTLHQRHFEPGEEAIWGGDQIVKIVHVIGDEAWIDCDGDGRVVTVRGLEKIPLKDADI